MNIETVIANANADSSKVGLFASLVFAVVVGEGGMIKIVNMNEAIIYYGSKEYLVSIAKDDDSAPYWVQGWI